MLAVKFSPEFKYNLLIASSVSVVLSVCQLWMSELIFNSFNYSGFIPPIHIILFITIFSYVIPSILIWKDIRKYGNLKSTFFASVWGGSAALALTLIIFVIIFVIFVILLALFSLLFVEFEYLLKPYDDISIPVQNEIKTIIWQISNIFASVFLVEYLINKHR